jgi:superfamily II DNA helicase RecQ
MNIFQRIKTQFLNQSGIIYCQTKARCEELSDFLAEKGINCDYYHADLEQESKNKRQRNWMENKLDIIIATVAFGMGIDKPDVRFIIHD